MFRFFLFLRGYYRIKAEGFGTERFINLCKIKNIYLWNFNIANNECKVNISSKDYMELSEIVNKTGVKVDILNKYGLPFWFHRKKGRKIFPLFIILALVLIFISNCFVWKVEFNGNYNITDEQLEDFLKHYDVSVGTLKHDIPFSILEENLRKEFGNIKWCSVSLLGNTLTIHVEENTLKEVNLINMETEMYSDIIAETDGVVKSVLVRNGLAVIKPGDKVLKGQILVTGAVPVYDDAFLIKSYHYYEADADVVIDGEMQYEEEIEKIHFDKEYTGRVKEIPYLKIGDKELLFSHKIKFAYYDISTSSKQVKFINKIELPLYYGTYKVREYYLTEKEYTKEEANIIFHKNLMNYYESLSEKGVQILKKDVKIEENADKWILKGNFVVLFQNLKKDYKEKQLENSVQ